MRVLFVHNHYQQPGGEDRAVELETKLLEEKGHLIKTLFFDNQKIKYSGLKILITLKNLLSNSSSAEILRKVVLEFKPDIIHVHNLFFIASPAILEEARRLRVPLVMTLHNYRLICCNALLLRENMPCEICIKKDIPLAGIRYACYRNSSLVSGAVMLSTGLPKLRHKWKQWAENYIVLTTFAKEKFQDSSLGAETDQLVVKPNFVHDPGFSEQPRESFFLFVGRLSHEKGTHFLLEAFKNMPEKKICIVGDGPEKNVLTARYSSLPNIEFLGKRNPAEVLDLMKKSLALVFPSIWYEGLPYVILEAFSTGTPILASDLGAMHSLIKDGYNGILFKPASTIHIQSAVLRFAEMAQGMYQNARDTYLRFYHPEIHFRSIMDIYENSIRNFAKRNGKRGPVISLMIDTISLSDSLSKVMEWGLAHKPTFVCFANVHMVIEAQQDPLFQKQVQEADLVLPDGKPVVKAFQWLHGTRLERKAGMDFLPRILETANQHRGRIFIYGSTNEVQEATILRITRDFPTVCVAGRIAPPFRKMSTGELQAHIGQINASGAHIVIVSLGCPKQEKWMAENSSSIKAVLLGLGGALDVFAGKRKRAPEWMQDNSLEWLYRLYQEPRRMFRRYLYTNIYFIFLLAKKMLRR